MPRGGARIGAGRKTETGGSAGMGGKREGAGRRVGTSDRALRKFSVDQVMAAVGSGPETTPLAFLLSIINLPRDADVKLSERIQCAIAAAPYCHPRLASIEMKTENASVLRVESDLGQALRELAELARLRDVTPDADIMAGSVLERGTMEVIEADIVSGHADILHNGADILHDEADIVSGLDRDEADIMAG